MSKEIVQYKTENQLEKAGSDIKAQIDALKITSRETYAQMGELVTVAKVGKNAVKDFFEDQRATTYKAYDTVLQKIRNFTKPWSDAERIGKQRMVGWDNIERERQRKAMAKQLEKGQAPTATNKAREVVSNVTYSDHWKGYITNKEEFLKAALKNTGMLDCVTFVPKELDKLAGRLTDKITIPGFEAKNERIASVGTK